MIIVDLVGFESLLNLGHKLGIEVEDSDWFMGSWEMCSASLSEYVMLNVMFNGLVEGGVEYDILHSGDVVVDSHTLDNRNKLLDSGSQDFCDLSLGGELRDVEELLLN